MIVIPPSNGGSGPDLTWKNGIAMILGLYLAGTITQCICDNDMANRLPEFYKHETIVQTVRVQYEWVKNIVQYMF